MKEEPSEQRVAYFRFLARFAFNNLSVHGGCFALLDPAGGGKFVAATLCAPPTTKSIHNTGVLVQIKYAFTLVKIPGGMDVLLRLSALGDGMDKLHHTHASQPHWYVGCFATDPECQGRGYGKQLLQFICALADADHAPVYLETAGVRNEGFYGHVGGFKTVEKRVVTSKQHRFDCDGGTIAMVREPKPDPIVVSSNTGGGEETKI